MSALTVHTKDGGIRTSLVKYQYNGNFMGDRTITASVSSPVKIAWEVGDYVELRGERFRMYTRPSAKKQARRGEYGAAIVYDNVTFYSAAQDLAIIKFKDYVLSDNKIHYSGLADFAFYMTKINDLGDRILANIERVYGKDAWQILYADKTDVSLGEDRNVYVKSEELFIKPQSVSVSSGTSVLDGLNMYNSLFDIDYIITLVGGKNTIVVGGKPTIRCSELAYGLGRGLVNLQRTAGDKTEVITRLHAYGSTRNMPYRYYNNHYRDYEKYTELFNSPSDYKLESMYINKLMLPYDQWVKGSEVCDAYIDSVNVSEYGLRESDVSFDGSDDKWDEIYPSIEGAAITDIKAGMTGTLTGSVSSSTYRYRDTLIDLLKENGYTEGETALDITTAFVNGHINNGFYLASYLGSSIYETYLKTATGGGMGSSIDRRSMLLTIVQGYEKFYYINRVRKYGTDTNSNYAMLSLNVPTDENNFNDLRQRVQNYDRPEDFAWAHSNSSDVDNLYWLKLSPYTKKIAGKYVSGRTMYNYRYDKEYLLYYANRYYIDQIERLGNCEDVNGNYINGITDHNIWDNEVNHPRVIWFGNPTIEDNNMSVDWASIEPNCLSLSNGRWYFDNNTIDREFSFTKQIAIHHGAAADEIMALYDFVKDNNLDWDNVKGSTQTNTYIITQEQIDSVSANLFPDGSGRLDKLVEADTIHDNGVSADGSYDSGAQDTQNTAINDTFTVRIPQLFFNPVDYKNASETPMLCMKSGMCAGREFEILNSVQDDDFARGYILTLKRDDSDVSSINMIFPNKEFQIHAGDEYVMTGIGMPDIYVQMAEQRLLRQAQKYLNEYDHERYMYTPEPDNIYLAKHPEIADGLMEGIELPFNDTDRGDNEGSVGDLGIGSKTVPIKTLIIKFNESNIPKYDIQLDDTTIILKSKNLSFK